MGCCQSMPNIRTLHSRRGNSTYVSTSFTQAEMAQFETFLAEMPEHSRQAINNLPARQLLNLYQYHTIASYHGLNKEWQIALSYEQHVIKGFRALLPTNKDHYIFFNFYSILAACFFALGDVQAAIQGIHITLAILLKHTPTDYISISNHYSYLAEAYKVNKNWKSTVQYLTKAIDAARMSNNLNQEYIHTLETDLQTVKQRLANDTHDQDIHRRRNAESVAVHTKSSRLSIEKTEFERLSNKKIESHVADAILRDVVKHL